MNEYEYFLNMNEYECVFVFIHKKNSKVIVQIS
jgi:hypothetical protein